MQRRCPLAFIARKFYRQTRPVLFKNKNQKVIGALRQLNPRENGEKLYEELLMSEEGMEDTGNNLIHIGKMIRFDEENFIEKLDQLKNAADNESDNIREIVQEIVPTYVVQRTDDG